MKKVKAEHLWIFVIIAILAVAGVVSADSNGTCGKYISYIIEGSTITFTATNSDNDWYTNCRDTIKSNNVTKAVLKESNGIKIKPKSGDSMFEGCEKLINLDLSGLDTSRMTRMDSMFYNCKKLTSLDLSKFNTENVKSMDSMFHTCESLRSLDLSNFNTAKVIYMDSMFNECVALTDLNISNFNTSSVTDMEWMFAHCESLKSLDLSNFDTSKVNDMSYMFSCTYALLDLDISSWNTNDDTSTDNMFMRAYSIDSIVLGPETLKKGFLTGANSEIANESWTYNEYGKAASKKYPLNTTDLTSSQLESENGVDIVGTWKIKFDPGNDENQNENPQNEGLGRLDILYRLGGFPEMCRNCSLPATGFGTKSKTPLSVQPDYLRYQDLHMVIQIPALNASADLVTVPVENNSWAVEWLCDRAGVLNGSAVPGEGYSLIAAHNTLNDTEYGPFALLAEANINDTIFVTNRFSEMLSYQVYANELMAPDSLAEIAAIMESEPGSLVLITCENESSDGSYLNRRVVFAKPIGE